MINTALMRIGVSALLLLYPFIVYFGLQTFQPRAMAAVLFILIALRLLAWNADKKFAVYWLAAGVLVILFTMITGSSLGLLFYPVAINVAFLTFFFLSLFHPPTVVERIARLQDPDFPDHAIPYTRKVTKAWCVFFVLNGAMSYCSIFVSEQWWALYNGFIAYVLIGAMFACEYGIRKIVMKKHEQQA